MANEINQVSVRGTLYDFPGAGQIDAYKAINNANFATVETTAAASKQYAANDYLIYNDILYRVTATIPQGDAIVVGTNVTKSAVGDQIALLNSTMNTLNSTMESIQNLMTKISTRIITPGHLRHKNLGSSVTAAQLEAIDNGTFYDEEVGDTIEVGDYWIISGVKYWVADINYYLHTGDTEFTKNHLLMKPATALYNYVWNDTNVTTNAYKGSKIRTSGLADARTTIKAAFGSANVLTHRILITNTMTNGYPSAGEWIDSDIELPTEEMWYGNKQFKPCVSAGGTIPYTYNIEKTQLALFALDKEALNARYNEWSRDPVSATYVARRNTSGNSSGDYASASLGVSPVFCLGKGA